MNYSDSANLGLLQVGMHRVERSENGPRRTLWYEVCTKYQVPKAIHFYGMKATPPVVSTIYPDIIGKYIIAKALSRLNFSSFGSKLFSIFNDTV
jgi:hypothetical protein